MADLSVDFDSLLRNENAKVIIDLGGGRRPVTGITHSEFAVSGGNEYNNPLESQKSQAASDFLNKAAHVGGRLFGVNISQFSLKNVEETIDFWTGSKKPEFNIPLRFVATRKSQDVRIPVAKLLAAVYPTKKDQFRLQAPLGYDPKTLKGLVTVKVGNWFQATKQLITDVQFSFSKEITNNGTPLYAEGTISFHPYQLITYKDMLGYLKLQSNVSSKEFYKG